jgi:hypothetical protein
MRFDLDLTVDRRQLISDATRERETPSVVGCVVLSLFVVFLFVVGTPQVASAQLYTGSVSGVVIDPTGAVIRGARLTLTDTEKGYSFNTATDATGRYLFSAVPPGTYRLTAGAAGFKTERKDSIVMDVNQNISSDFSLAVGSPDSIVEVTASPVHLQTEDAVTGQVVDRKFINNLPLLDRNFTNLTRLAPGLTETNTRNGGAVNFNSDGGRNSTADVLIDGASATNFEQNSGITTFPYTPSVDSVEEFKVEQSNFNAEFGFAGGTVINVITRSGNNQFHGSAFEFLRNSATDANSWFANKNGVPIPALKHNDFGGTFGGPIKKDKTFFFVDYEGRILRDFASRTQGVPTLCERGDPNANCPVGAPALGNFGEVCTLRGGVFDSSGKCRDNKGNLLAAGQLWDPYTGTPNGIGATRSAFIPFNNVATYVSPGNPLLAGTPFQPAAGVRGNLIDPVARQMFLLYPLPTIAAQDLATAQTKNFFVSGVSPSSQNQGDLKIDHRFSESDLLSVRYSQESQSSSSFNAFKNFADPGSGGPGEATRHLVALNHTHTFNSSMLFTLTYGYVRAFTFQHGIGGDFPNIDSSFTQLGFPAYLNHGFHVLPRIGVGSGYNASIGTATFSIEREGSDAHDLGGALNWTRGKHELKFGGDLRMSRINQAQPGWPAGDFGFNRSSTARVSNRGTTGGDGLASFLIGVGPPGDAGGGCTPCQVGFVNAVSTQSFRYAGFVQDNYRATSKLTLNLGLRYEISTPRTERFNRMNWLDPNVVSPLQVPGLATLHGGEVFANPNDRSNYYPDYKDIQPRFGFAYQLPHAFVARGGYGIYYTPPRSGAAGTGPWGYQGFDIQPPWLTTLNLDGATPYNTLKNTSCLAPNAAGVVTCGVPSPPGASLGLLNDVGNAAVGPIRGVSQNIPYEQIWSFGVQKQLGWKTLLDANYIGKKGTHLYLGGFRDLNFLGPAVMALSPTDRGNLNNLVDNPFFFSGSGSCDPKRFICDPTAALGGPQIPAFQSPDQPIHVPFPQFAGFQGDSPPIANSIYHSLQLRAERGFSNGLQFLVTYTWSKSIDNASATDDSLSFLGGGTTGGDTLGVQNPNDLRAERAVSVFDITHVLQFSYVYELPFGRGKWLGKDMNPVLNAIAGGWQTNGIVRIDSGRPIIPGLDGSLGAQSIPTFGMRPNLTGSLGRSSGRPENFTDTGNSANFFANPNALSQPDDFTFGTAPRTISNVRQPGARDVSMSLFKEIGLAQVREGMHMELRVESFNTFNHPRFGGPNANFGSPTYGKISNTVNSPRQMQFGLKLLF